MFRMISDYVQTVFCKHEWELIGKSNVIDIPPKTRWIYRCKKCGHKKVIEG